MNVKLLSFLWNNSVRVGVYTEKGVLDLPSTYMSIYDATESPSFLYDMRSLISSGGEPALAMVRELVDKALRSGDIALFRDPNAITWLPPVLNPEKVLCVAVNYRLMVRKARQNPPLIGHTSSQNSQMHSLVIINQYSSPRSRSRLIGRWNWQ